MSVQQFEPFYKSEKLDFRISFECGIMARRTTEAMYTVLIENDIQMRDSFGTAETFISDATEGYPMVRDRIVESGTRRILLPSFCASSAGVLCTGELKTVLSSDRHSVLITGDTGTGKEMLADCVKQMTKRPKGKFQPLNCAGLDSNLVGSELFGHKKGAFTGAVVDRQGLLKACDGGVLFLDEIGWLLPDMQARLLRFMEDRWIRPIGADCAECQVNVRIVAATNKNVSDDKVMIPDLRARFDFEVHLPPLCERSEDLLWFICEPGFLGSGDVFTGITLRTLVGILTNEWSGNIRALKKYCQGKVILNPVNSANGEDLHVLEDWDIGNREHIDSVAGFAGLVLSAFEKLLTKNKLRLEDVQVRNFVSLMLELRYGMWEIFALGDEDVPVMPLALLREAANGTLKEGIELDFKTTMLCALEEYQRDVFEIVENSCPLLLDPSDIDFGGVLSLISTAAKKVAEDMPEALTCTRVIDGKLAKGPVGPSQAFLDRIDRMGFVKGLFSMPPPPHVEHGIEQVLNDLGTMEQDRSIALLCNRGLSNKEISEKVGLKPTTVGERLVKLRGQEKLKDLLPKQHAGRKASKRPD